MQSVKTLLPAVLILFASIDARAQIAHKLAVIEADVERITAPIAISPLQLDSVQKDDEIAHRPAAETIVRHVGAWAGVGLLTGLAVGVGEYALAEPDNPWRGIGLWIGPIFGTMFGAGVGVLHGSIVAINR